MENIIKNITDACKDKFDAAIEREINNLKALYAEYCAAPSKYEFFTELFGIEPANMKKSKHDQYTALNHKFAMVAAGKVELFTEAERAQMVIDLTAKLIENVNKYCQAYSEISNIVVTSTEKGFAINARLDGKATIKTDCILVWGPIVRAHYRYICKVK